MHMSRTSVPYAQVQGIRLLEAAVQEFGPLFTRQDIEPLAAQQGLSTGHLSKLLSVLNASGYLEIIKRGVYVVKSPLFAGEIHPFAIAAALVQPLAISHWSALAHHGFTTQAPTMVQASTPCAVVTPEMRRGRANRPRGRAVWRALGQEIEYIHVPAPRFFGHQRIWVDTWRQVDITDPERTALDLLARPDVFGSVRSVIEILEENLTRLDLSRLVAYTLRYGMGSVVKRMGWTLEHLGVGEEIVAPLQSYPVKSYYRLDPQSSDYGTPNRRWHIWENLARPENG